MAKSSKQPSGSSRRAVRSRYRETSRRSWSSTSPCCARSRNEPDKSSSVLLREEVVSFAAQRFHSGPGHVTVQDVMPRVPGLAIAGWCLVVVIGGAASGCRSKPEPAKADAGLTIRNTLLATLPPLPRDTTTIAAFRPSHSGALVAIGQALGGRAPSCWKAALDGIDAHYQVSDSTPNAANILRVHLGRDAIEACIREVLPLLGYSAQLRRTGDLTEIETSDRTRSYLAFRGPWVYWHADRARVARLFDLEKDDLPPVLDGLLVRLRAEPPTDLAFASTLDVGRLLLGVSVVGFAAYERGDPLDAPIPITLLFRDEADATKALSLIDGGLVGADPALLRAIDASKPSRKGPEILLDGRPLAKEPAATQALGRAVQRQAPVVAPF